MGKKKSNSRARFGKRAIITVATYEDENKNDFNSAQKKEEEEEIITSAGEKHDCDRQKTRSLYNIVVEFTFGLKLHIHFAI